MNPDESFRPLRPPAGHAPPAAGPYDAKDQLTGVIAKTFTTEPGAKAVDITLKPGLTFHDGSPVTASC